MFRVLLFITLLILCLSSTVFALDMPEESQRKTQDPKTLDSILEKHQQIEKNKKIAEQTRLAEESRGTPPPPVVASDDKHAKDERPDLPKRNSRMADPSEIRSRPHQSRDYRDAQEEARKRRQYLQDRIQQTLDNEILPPHMQGEEKVALPHGMKRNRKQEL